MSRAVRIDPKDVPPPTPITLPHGHPGLQTAPTDATASELSLVNYLQTLYRPAEVSSAIFEALGVHVINDVPLRDLLPDTSLLPDFDAWDQLSADEAREQNDATKRTLNTGAPSPGVQTYQDRKRELSIPNDDAFRVVRRMPPPKGKQQARLGNAYEFYRCLESMTTFWDDTSRPPPANPSSPPSQPGQDNQSPETAQDDEPAGAIRTSAGSSTPFEFRQNLIHAFLKLVAYDFGCSAQAARAEPRLQVRAPPPAQRSSYFASGCTFVFRSPRTRDAARQGLVDGPVAAVSARATTSFETEHDHDIDFARELVAALVTAQQRTRQGKSERRPGEGTWWTTKPRWGGGTGGPIGREIDRDAVQGDKDARPSETAGAGAAAPTPRASGMPATKRPRKQMSIYDNYRMVRPPSASWDAKARYEAIGRVPGAGYDDVFVVSSLFHHVSILRFRVPDRLLEVLDGAADQGGRRSWGKLEVRRSKWFDLFLVEERVEAVKMFWALLAWMMRQTEQEGTNKDGDVKMTNT